jgi:ATP-dependent Lon protease
VGVVADVSERLRVSGRGLAVALMGVHRASLGGASADQDGVLRVDYEARPDATPATSLTRDLEREYRAVVDEILELRGDDGRIRAFVRSITDAGALADTAGYSPDFSFAQKVQLLETLDVVERLTLALQFQRDRLAEMQVRKRIRDDVEDGAQKQQREYFLQQQLKSIKDELGGDANEREVAEMRKKAESKKWPQAAKDMFQSGIAKLERMHPSTPDYSVVYNHLDLMLDLPWEEYSTDNYDLKRARQILDNDHYGMKKIKERILEYIAVLKLKGDMKSPILCFVGPPGIGKTSLGRSIAGAIGRK